MQSEAQKKAKAKYELKAYDKIPIRFPKGLKDDVLSLNPDSFNGFVVQAVKEKIENMT